MEKQVDIDLAGKIPGIPHGIEEAAFEEPNVGRAGEQGNDHDGMNGVQASAAGDGLENTGNLTFQPAGFGFPVLFSRTEMS